MNIEQKGKHASVVQRLRHPLTDRSTEKQIIDKWNAIGEALAYIIEKKHDKRKIKLGKKHKKDR